MSDTPASPFLPLLQRIADALNLDLEVRFKKPRQQPRRTRRTA